MEQQIEIVSPRHGMGAVLNGVSTILCILLFPVLMVNLILIGQSMLYPENVPSLFGTSAFVVLTESMEPQIQSGDLIFTRQADPEAIQEGTIISFFDPAGNGTSVVTHQVVRVDTSEGLAFQTKGIHNNTEDSSLVPADHVIGVYQFRIPRAGSLLMALQTRQGMLLAIGLPCLMLAAVYGLQQKRSSQEKKQEADALRQEIERLKAGHSAESGE